MKVSNYIICYRDADGNGQEDYLQALSAQQAADMAREYFGATEIIDIAKVVRNWK